MPSTAYEKYLTPLRWRVLSAAVFWPGLAVALVCLPSRGFGMLAAAAITVSFVEYLRLLVFPRNRPVGWVATVAGCVCTLPFVTNSLELSVVILVLGSLLVVAMPMVAHGSISDSLSAAAFAVAGLIYIVLPLGLIILLRYRVGGVYQIGFLFTITWARDVGAFLVGQTLRVKNLHLINLSISHKKTYEGAIGGIIASIVAALITRSWLGHEVSLPSLIALGFLIGIVGQIGDLVESLIKRVAGAANSSNLIPGQGGLLDTLDSFIYTTPVLYVFTMFKS